MQDIILRDRDLSFRSREAYRTLRSNIEFSGKNVRTIAITSCTPDEGKSEVSFELSRSFAQNKQRVLLIDADMRKSVMASSVQKGRIRYGLSNYLIGQCSLEQCICRTNLDGLYMIFSGPSTPTPSELLGSEAFDQLLSECRKLYDYIVRRCDSRDRKRLYQLYFRAGCERAACQGKLSYTRDCSEQSPYGQQRLLREILRKVLWKLLRERQRKGRHLKLQSQRPQ